MLNGELNRIFNAIIANNTLTYRDFMLSLIGRKMKMFVLKILPLFLLLFTDNYFISIPKDINECTIGVFSGRVTSDGRPLLWKNRDVTNAVQKFCFYRRSPDSQGTTYGYLGNVFSSDTTKVYMGLNEAGFAIMNSNSYNLGDSVSRGYTDGDLIRIALERCGSLSQFESLLTETGIEGRRDCWNVGAFDASGNVAMYEVANRSFAKFDANDTANGCPGYVVRATFSLTGGSNHDGEPRFKRATHLVNEYLQSSLIDAKYILQTLSRDLSNPLENPYPLPYNGSQNGKPAGFILARDITINRTITRSVAVMRGVLPGEDPALATIYGVIGPPVISVAYPMWVKSGSAPSFINAGNEVPMYNQVQRHMSRLYSISNDNTYLDSRYLVGKDGIGMYSYILPLESAILDQVDEYLSDWRQQVPSTEEFAFVQHQMAGTIYNSYCDIPLDFQRIVEEPMAKIALSCYPNPFNQNTNISVANYEGDNPVNISIYNILGEKVRRFGLNTSTDQNIAWDGKDDNGNSLSSGVYLIVASNNISSKSIKSVLLK